LDSFFFAIFISTFLKINVVVVEPILGYLLSVEKAYASKFVMIVNYSYDCLRHSVVMVVQKKSVFQFFT